MIGEEGQGHPLPPGFEDVEPLASTGCGQVYRARVAAADGHVETVGVTVVDTAVRGRDARRLRAECLAAVAISAEPGVLAVRDLGFTKDHRPFLVTDAPLAGTLATRIQRHGPLPFGEVVALGLRLARALGAAHRAGILHLGIGPDVVFPTPDGPVLGHFGLAWAVRRPSQPDVPAMSIVHAPRELFGWEEPTVGSDVYSLASVLRTALDGRAPFETEARTGRPALYHRLVQGAPDPLRHPGVPAPMAELLERMMGPDPVRRPGVDEVVRTLEEVARAGQISTEWVVAPVMQQPVAQQPTVPVAAATVAPVAPIAQRPPVTAEPLAADAATTPRGLRSTMPVPAKPEAATAQIAAPAVPATQIAPPQVASPPTATAASQPQPQLQPQPMAPPPFPPQPMAPPPPQPTAPPAQHPVTDSATPRRRNTGLILLVAAGSAALAAGVAWGVATAPKQSTAAQNAGPVVAIATFDGSQRAAYQATNARATATGTDISVTWATPRQSAGVQSYIVVVASHNQTVRTTTVPATGAATTLSTSFTGLLPSVTYCVSIMTYAVAPGDQTPHIATPDQCALVTTDPSAAGTGPAAGGSSGSAA